MVTIYGLYDNYLFVYKREIPPSIGTFPMWHSYLAHKIADLVLRFQIYLYKVSSGCDTEVLVLYLHDGSTPSPPTVGCPPYP